MLVWCSLFPPSSPGRGDRDEHRGHDQEIDDRRDGDPRHVTHHAPSLNQIMMAPPGRYFHHPYLLLISTVNVVHMNMSINVKMIHAAKKNKYGIIHPPFRLQITS